MNYDAITSDSHYGHFRICEYTNRPYHSAGEMNEALIYHWNQVITPEMNVIHLGDFSLSAQIIPEILSRLNYKTLTLICGNHDYHPWKYLTTKKETQQHWIQQYKDWGFTEILFDTYIEIGEFKVYCSHLPYRGSGDHTPTERYEPYRKVDDGICHGHGHRHSSPEEKVRHTKKGTLELDLGVDGHGMRPYLIEEIHQLIKDNI